MTIQRRNIDTVSEKKRPAPGEQRGPLVLKPLVRDSDERILKTFSAG
jgi:hypothetical protein